MIDPVRSIDAHGVVYRNQPRILVADNPYWDGKIHKTVKFGDPFDSRTVEGRKRATQRAAHVRRAKAEVEALRAEEQSWSFWGAILRRFGRN